MNKQTINENILLSPTVCYQMLFIVEILLEP